MQHTGKENGMLKLEGVLPRLCYITSLSLIASYGRNDNSENGNNCVAQVFNLVPSWNDAATRRRSIGNAAKLQKKCINIAREGCLWPECTRAFLCAWKVAGLALGGVHAWYGAAWYVDVRLYSEGVWMTCFHQKIGWQNWPPTNVRIGGIIKFFEERGLHQWKLPETSHHKHTFLSVVVRLSGQSIICLGSIPVQHWLHELFSLHQRDSFSEIPQ